MMTEGGIVEQKEAVIVRQWRNKHVSAETNKHAATGKQCFLCSLCQGYIARPTFGSRRLAVLSCTVIHCYQAMTSEDT
jgi:hypothetical protein